MAACSLESYCDLVLKENQWKLDKQIDFEHNGVPTHLGAIADAMDEWEGPVAERLGLTAVNVSSIKCKYPDNLKLQTRECLHIWQEKNGLMATYRKLIDVFLEVEKTSYAEAVCRVLGMNSKPGNELKHSLSSSSSNNPLSPSASVSSPLTSPTSSVFSQGMLSGPLVVQQSEAKLREDFTILLQRISDKLMELKINMKHLCRHVASLFPPDFSPTAEFEIPMDIFIALQKNKLVTHLDYNPPLQSIAKMFDNSDESPVGALVKEYALRREAFIATTKLADYISKCETEEEADPDEPLVIDKTKYDATYLRKLRIKLNIKIRDKTLEYIDDLWRSIADEFQLPPLSALLDTVIDGSLIIVWRVHELIIQHILERMSDASDFFRSHQITEVFIDDVCFYKDTEQFDMGETDSDYALPRGIDEHSTSPLSEHEMDSESKTLQELQTTEQLESTRPTVWKRFTNWVQSGATWLQVGVLNAKLLQASRRGNVESVQELLKNGAEPNCRQTKEPFHFRWTPLMLASHNGHYDVAKVLLLNGADPNIGDIANWTALILSSRNGHHEVVKLLLENGALVNEKNKFGWNALMWASQCRDYLGAKISTNPEKKANLHRVCVYLLSYGADPNIEDKNGWSPVMQASQDDHAEFVKLLTESGRVDINHLEKKRDTFALMVAATKGHTEVVETLAACGADLNLRNKKNQAAIHVACYKGHTKIVEKLVEHGADLEIKDKMGLTPLSIATKSRSEQIMKLLCKTGRVDVNTQAEKYANWTPLNFAVKDGNLDAVKLLLENGARVDIKDINGQSVVGIAKTFNNWQKIKHLMLEFYNERARVAEPQTPIGTTQSASVGTQLEPLVHQTTDIDQISRVDSDTVDSVEIRLQPTLSATKEMLEEDATVPSVKHDVDKRKREQKFLIEEERRHSTAIHRGSYRAYESSFNEMMLPTIAAAA